MSTIGINKRRWKYPLDDFTFQLDWSVAGRMPPGATTPSSVVATMEDSAGQDVTGTLIAASDVSGTFTRVRVQAGTAGEVYALKQVVTFDNGEVLVDFVDIEVKPI